MTRYSCLLASLAVHLLLHVGHATPAADLEPCAPGSGRPKPAAAPPPPAATAPSVTAASNLLAWYQFDTTPTDQATLVNHGTGGASFDATIHMQTNGIEQIAGSHANHAYFWPANSAHGNWLEIDGSMAATLDQTGYTISFWMADNDITDRDSTIIIGKKIDQSVSDLSIQIAPPYFSNVYHNNQGSSYASLSTDSNVIANGEFAFMTFVRKNIDASTMVLEIWKNSALIADNSYAAVDFIHASSPDTIVMLGFNLDDTWSFRDKHLEDFRIYDRALTAEEIAAIYAGDLGSAEESIAEANPAPVSTACEACTPGFFSPNGTTCEPCAPGSFSTHYNATSCDNCNATSTSFRGTSRCFDTAAHLAATGCLCGV